MESEKTIEKINKAIDEIDNEIEEPEIIYEPGVEMDEKKFRFQNTYGLLTYKTHLDKKDYIKWINEKCKGTRWIRLAHETGDVHCPYNHTHVVIDFGKKFETTNCRFFDYDKEDSDSEENIVIHPHIKKLIGKKAFEDAKKYIAKEDPDNADLLERPNWVTTTLNAKSGFDAVKKLCGGPKGFGPNDVAGIVALKSMAGGDYRIRTKAKQITLRKWQQELCDELENNEPNPDRVIWIWNKKGRCGKRIIGLYMRDHCLSEDGLPKYEYTTDLGTSYHAATTIKGMCERGWQQWGLFINLVRSSENHDRIYDYIEAISDGELCVQKYQGMPLSFDPPHLIILANWAPKVAKLSTPRWDIRSVDQNDDGEWVMTKVNAWELKREQKLSSNDGFTSLVKPKRRVIINRKAPEVTEPTVTVMDELFAKINAV